MSEQPPITVSEDQAVAVAKLVVSKRGTAIRWLPPKNPMKVSEIFVDLWVARDWVRYKVTPNGCVLGSRNVEGTRLQAAYVVPVVL